MELTDLKSRANVLFNKYKYVALVLLIGLILMMIPNENKSKTTSKQNEEKTIQYPAATSLEDKLSQLLSNVEGAGRVEVMLTIASGEEVVYQIDENRSIADSSNNSNSHTVTVTNSDREQEGLVKQVNPATYKGAIILCHGADDPTVRLQIVEAVSRITGLGTNCISVLKMK